MANRRRAVPSAPGVVAGKAGARSQRQPAIAYGGPVKKTQLGAYPNGVRREKTSRKRILELWTERWGVQLTEAQQQRFLEHPATTRITQSSTARVKAAIDRFKKLDDIAAHLDQ